MSINEQEDELDFFTNEEDGDVKILAKLDHHEAMLGGMVRIGTVVSEGSKDPKAPDDIPRVLVHIGGKTQGSFIRTWMPWSSARAGYDGEWWVPEKDEQVIVVAPSGNLALGVIVGSLFRGALTFESDNDGKVKPQEPLPQRVKPTGNIHKRVYKDGSSVIYDREKHQFILSAKTKPEDEDQDGILMSLTAKDEVLLSAGKTQIRLKKDGNITIAAKDSAITIEGDVTVKGTLNVE
ncbi:phage baseplate assembly protein V [Marinibactrum halimedae]|uniref:Gp5/Type VI secretion system Vgr protein OB-fold domain-containing protein n=1 Tax=Marinibactrum halimedae TaxID=1444977 RepID=A0AA37WMR6_9GAMM|nr:phage baseplate assembly protein V [Marinibactrum halimedae]MCD9460777.1 phage baseplate assembly protein V [Marinibactrum halimedae]GLS27364.1 hypothetical protein GCM10007877_30830 [Marinibactrum halimedae]